jgi:long-chain acyl-CoA synthetase
MEGLDLVVNCAGLVDFNPSLELAVQVNARGAGHAVGLCRRTGAALLHVSTCFVAGNRDGVVFEDEPVRGYFPRREDVVPRPKGGPLDPGGFDPDEELADCERRVAQAREAAEDRTLLSAFRQRALERLRQEGRDPGDEKALRTATAREKRLWIAQRLVDLGMERARHWGWPNTYTYTKSLGEQVVAGSDVRWAIARPSIVESALRHPFPGWNEGFTTSAPLAYLSLQGHRAYPGRTGAILDVVPVDLVAAGLVAIAADLLDRGRRSAGGRTYHLASGDVNPFLVSRCFELVGLHQRRLYLARREGSPLVNLIRARLEPYRVDRDHFERFSTPATERWVGAARRLVESRAPRWGAPRAQALAGRLAAGPGRSGSPAAGGSSSSSCPSSGRTATSSSAPASGGCGSGWSPPTGPASPGIRRRSTGAPTGSTCTCGGWSAGSSRPWTPSWSASAPPAPTATSSSSSPPRPRPTGAGWPCG